MPRWAETHTAASSNARIAAHGDVGRSAAAVPRSHRRDRATGAWADDGARDLAQWLWMRYGISDWKARRLIDAAAALPTLPAIAGALERGDARHRQGRRACTVRDGRDRGRPDPVGTASVGGSHPSRGRRRAPRRARRGDTRRRGRSLTWAFRDEGRRFEMHADLPAAQGAVVAKAIDRVAAAIPLSPTSRVISHAPARRADALVGCVRRGSRPNPTSSGRRSYSTRGWGSSASRRAPRSRAAAWHTLDPRTAALRRPRRDRARGRRGPRDRHGTDHAGPTAVAAPAGPLPRRWMPVPGVRHQGVHPGAPHRVLARRRLDRPRQPRHPLLVAPQARARIRLVDQGQRPGRSPVVPARRRALRGRSFHPGARPAGHSPRPA